MSWENYRETNTGRYNLNLMFFSFHSRIGTGKPDTGTTELPQLLLSSPALAPALQPIEPLKEEKKKKKKKKKKKTKENTPYDQYHVNEAYEEEMNGTISKEHTD